MRPTSILFLLIAAVLTFSSSTVTAEEEKDAMLLVKCARRDLHRALVALRELDVDCYDLETMHRVALVTPQPGLRRLADAAGIARDASRALQLVETADGSPAVEVVKLRVTPRRLGVSIRLKTLEALPAIRVALEESPPLCARTGGRPHIEWGPSREQAEGWVTEFSLALNEPLGPAEVIEGGIEKIDLAPVWKCLEEAEARVLYASGLRKTQQGAIITLHQNLTIQAPTWASVADLLERLSDATAATITEASVLPASETKDGTLGPRLEVRLAIRVVPPK